MEEKRNKAQMTAFEDEYLDLLVKLVNKVDNLTSVLSNHFLQQEQWFQKDLLEILRGIKR